MFSRLELAPPPSGVTATPGPSDGQLEVHELFGLPIRSPLVFLSGCGTALGAGTGEELAGEDYATLARAFLYAGAQNVVATLWPIDDAAAAEFAGTFYGSLGETDAVSALARAQRAMIGHARLAHPYFWAAYRLSGDGALNGFPHIQAVTSVSER